ncbi:MAG TPA: hypothetical protein VFO27_18345 [Bryobacteraceae bacterium]|nr:hypothetical protein [Bryobacteraceae bacterium]
MQKTAICACILFVAQHRALAQTAAGDEIQKRANAAAAAAAPRQQPFIPMTQAQRLRYYFNSTFSLSTVAVAAAGAGTLQLWNIPKEWGQGAEGYGRRMGDLYGQHIIVQTLMYGSSSLLHEDNRYFRSGKPGLWPRLKYAAMSALITRRDDGSTRFAYTRIGSFAAGAFISRAWQPRSITSAGDGAVNFGSFVAVQVGFNVAREFFPRFIHDP